MPHKYDLFVDNFRPIGETNIDTFMVQLWNVYVEQKRNIFSVFIRNEQKAAQKRAHQYQFVVIDEKSYVCLYTTCVCMIKWRGVCWLSQKRQLVRATYLSACERQHMVFWKSLSSIEIEIDCLIKITLRPMSSVPYNFTFQYKYIFIEAILIRKMNFPDLRWSKIQKIYRFCSATNKNWSIKLNYGLFHYMFHRLFQFDCNYYKKHLSVADWIARCSHNCTNYVFMWICDYVTRPHKRTAHKKDTIVSKYMHSMYTAI